MRLSSGSDSESEQFTDKKNKKSSSTLDLRENKLKGNIILGNYSSLAEIDISDNFIESLDLSAVDHLVSLNCSNNRLRHLALNAKKLQILIVNHNYLMKVSIAPTKPTKLKHLDLSFNELTQIPDWFYDCKNIQTLNVGYNKLTVLPDLFIASEMSHFRHLYLNHNNLVSFPNLFVCDSPIAKLTLEHNNLSSLPKHFFRIFSNLKELNLSCNHLNELPQLDLSPLKIETISLTCNNFMDKTMDFLAKFCPKLKRFYGAYNLFSFVPNDCSVHWPDLIELNLSANRLFRIPNSLTSAKHLQIVRIHSNKLKTIPSFASMTNLKILDISHNDIERIDFSQLLATQLQFLDISGNQQLRIDSSKLFDYKSHKTLSLIDVTGLNRSLLTNVSTAQKKNNYPEIALNNNYWNVGFSETSGTHLKNHLYISQVRNVNFGNREALFAIFDNEKIVEQPTIATKLLQRFLLEEKAKQVNDIHYLIRTVLELQKDLGCAQQKLRQPHRIDRLLITHLCYENRKLIAKFAVLNEIRAIVGRRDGTYQTIATKSHNSITYIEMEIERNDRFLLIANYGFWQVFPKMSHLMSLIDLSLDPIRVAKKFQDLAQSYGADSNLSVIFVRIDFQHDQQQFPTLVERHSSDQKIIIDFEDNESISTTGGNNCCENLNCEHRLTKPIHPRTSPSGQSDPGPMNNDNSSTSTGTTVPSTKMFLRNERKSYRNGGVIGKLLKVKKEEINERNGSGSDKERYDSDSGLSEEQFKCWEYMLERNTQMLFDKELNTISKSSRKCSAPRSRKRLTRSNPHLADDRSICSSVCSATTSGSNAAFLGRYFGMTSSSLSSSKWNPLMSRVGQSRSLSSLNSGPNAAYFGSLQRLLPYNSEYNFANMQEKPHLDSIDFSGRRPNENIAITEL